MTLVLDPTVGGANANTWATLAEAEAYLEGRLNLGSWATAEDETKNAALVQAARRLSRERYHGLPVTSTQALAFPREGLEDERGELIAEDVIPRGVKEAQIEEALALVRSPARQDPSALAGFASIGVGPIALATKQAAPSANALTPAAVQYLRPYRLGGAGTIDLVRA